MDGPDEARRHHVTASVTGGRAAPGPDSQAAGQVSTDPDVLALTEEERLNGLQLFAAEQAQEFERVPAHVDRIALPARTLEHATPPPVQPDAQRWLAWQEPLLAAVLTAVVVAFGVMSVRMRTPTDGQLAALNDRIAERIKAARDLPAPAAVAAVPSSGVPRAADAPATPSAAARSDEVPASRKVNEPSVRRESASVRAPAPPTPPIASGREATRVRRDPPIQSASASSPGTAEPVPIVEPAAAPLLGSLTPPASLPVEPSPVVAVAAALPSPRAEVSAAPVPRMPAPETAIQTVLAQYRTAYGDLNAGAARVVWPNVDAKALRKAFERLEEQRLIFNSCQIAVSNVRAVASCDGSVRYVPRVGNREPHDDRRQWEFKLSKVADVWQIDTVAAR